MSPRQRIDVTANPGGDSGIAGGVKINEAMDADDALQAAVGVPVDATQLGPVESFADVIEAASVDEDTVKKRLDKHEFRVTEVEAASSVNTDITIRSDDSLQIKDSPFRVTPPTPPLEGSQSDVLFVGGGFGSDLGFNVASYGDKALAHEARQIAASAKITDFALWKGATVRVRAVGSFFADSADPRMLFDLALGRRGSEIPIRPVTGTLRPNLPVNLPSNGIEISYNTCGPNALNFVNPNAPFGLETIDWELTLDVHFLAEGNDGDVRGGSRGAFNTRVTGSVKWGFLRECGSSGGTRPGPFIQGQSTGWGVYRQGGIWERGAICVNHGIPYRAMWDMPAVPIDGSTATSEEPFQAHVEANRDLAHDIRERYEPGSSRFWPRHWARLRNEMPVDFLTNVDLTAPDQFLHLRLGGPTVTDPTIVAPNWVGAGSSTDFYHALSSGSIQPETAGLCQSQSRTYVARTDHSYNESVQPDVGDPGGRWNSLWRLMSPVRTDKMEMHYATMELVGGGAGVSDTVRMV